MTQPLPPKKEVALALLERSNVDIYLDPRAKGVVVPPQFRKEPRLILKIGLNMPVPIPDLRLDEESMSCTLSFNRSPFYCVVPWPSVFAMVGDDGRGMVWPDDVPQELAVRVADEQSAAPEERAPSPSSGRGKGRVRGGEASAGPRAPDSDRAGGTAKRGKKKKKEEARPLLVAVPAPPADGPSDARPSAQDAKDAQDAKARATERDDSRQDGVPADKEAAARHAGRPLPPPGASQPGSRGTQSRPKRELPPYLRVVK